MGETDIPSHPEMPDVTIGFHKNLSAQPPEDEDEEVTIAGAEREKALQDPVIQGLATRLGVPVHFLLDYRERAVDSSARSWTEPRVSLTLLLNQCLSGWLELASVWPRSSAAR